MAIMSATKKGISAKELQRQLGHKRYRTIWVMMQKIREGMGNQENDDFANQFGFSETNIECIEPPVSTINTRTFNESKPKIRFAKFRVVLNDFTLCKTEISGVLKKNNSVFLSGSKEGMIQSQEVLLCHNQGD